MGQYWAEKIAHQRLDGSVPLLRMNMQFRWTWVRLSFKNDSSEFFVGKEFWRFATLDDSISMEPVGRSHVD